MKRRVSLTHRESLMTWARNHRHGAVVDLLRDVAHLERRLKCISEILHDGYCGDSYNFHDVNVAHGIAAGCPLPRAVRLARTTGEATT